MRDAGRIGDALNASRVVLIAWRRCQPAAAPA